MDSEEQPRVTKIASLGAFSTAGQGERGRGGVELRDVKTEAAFERK